MQTHAEKSSLVIGETAPYFSLPATDGKIYSLSDFVDCQALVVIFTCNHCPYAKAYEARLSELAKRYAPQGVGFVGICANDAEDYPEDSFEHMVERSKALGFPYPYLHDKTQNVARAYDAACTPECYLFNKGRALVYHGWVDDNHLRPDLVNSPDLKNALDSVLAGQMPKNQLTAVIGCSIKWRD